MSLTTHLACNIHAFASPDGNEYPGADFVLVLPVTPEPVLIYETMVSTLSGEYKPHFPKDIRKNIK